MRNLHVKKQISCDCMWKFLVACEQINKKTTVNYHMQFSSENVHFSCGNFPSYVTKYNQLLECLIHMCYYFGFTFLKIASCTIYM